MRTLNYKIERARSNIKYVLSTQLCRRKLNLIIPNIYLPFCGQIFSMLFLLLLGEAHNNQKSEINSGTKKHIIANFASKSQYLAPFYSYYSITLITSKLMLLSFLVLFLY